MIKRVRKLFALLIIAGLLLIIACKLSSDRNTEITPTPSTSPPVTTAIGTGIPVTKPAETQPAVTSIPEPTNPPVVKEPVDYTTIKPDESGEIPIVMFHNFIKDLNDTGDVEWTTSFSAFEELLETLYEKGYRLISMRDFIDHNITVPEGKIPIVFTFDDGSEGQFNLIEKNGKLAVNPESAVGVMLKFNEKHSDFGLKGIFYLNMDKEEKTFEGAGSLKERLEILLGCGFEIGNHSWGHFKFETAKDRLQIYEKLGKNEKRLQQVIPDMSFYSLALPFGSNAPENMRDALAKGDYEGISYINETIMAVGYLPSVPSIHMEYDSTYVRRIRSQGKAEIKFDLTYWLPLMTRSRMYISDGDPDTVVVPKEKENKIDPRRLNGKTVITY